MGNPERNQPIKEWLQDGVTSFGLPYMVKWKLYNNGYTSFEITYGEAQCMGKNT